MDNSSIQHRSRRGHLIHHPAGGGHRIAEPYRWPVLRTAADSAPNWLFCAARPGRTRDSYAAHARQGGRPDAKSASRSVTGLVGGLRARSAVRSGQGCLGGHQVSRADPGCSVRLPLAWAATGVDCGRGSVRSDCCPSRAIGKDRCCGGPFRRALQKPGATEGAPRRLSGVPDRAPMRESSPGRSYGTGSPRYRRPALNVAQHIDHLSIRGRGRRSGERPTARGSKGRQSPRPPGPLPRGRRPRHPPEPRHRG